MDSDLQYVFNMTREQRLQLIADLIIGKIIEDQKQGYSLLRKIQAEEEKASDKDPKKDV